MRPAPITIIARAAVVVSLACDLPSTIKPFAKDLLGKLKDAIVDIDPAQVGKERLCQAYMDKGRMLAEDAWTHQWPKFAPLWQTARDPATDLVYCHNLIMEAGATIVEKQSDSGAASAVCMQAQFPKDFESRPLGEQAAITCHEAAHILEQKTVGCVEWNAKYFATISARLTYEGTAYALMWALFERYGWSKEQAEAEIRRRAERFPERYSIPREIITDECTFAHWSNIRGALRERAGV